MAESGATLPAPGPDQRRIAAGQYERASEVIANGDYDYAMPLLLNCCKIDPGNLIYRKSLRRAQRKKHHDNKRGSWLAWLTNVLPKAQIKKATRNRDWLQILDLGEKALMRNPWDIGILRDMAEAADHLGLDDLAIWILEDSHKHAPKNIPVIRQLARMYEQAGRFQEAISLWELIRKLDPSDTEAVDKAKDLAANETIARGQYDKSVSGLSGSRSRPAEKPPSKSSSKAKKKKREEEKKEPEPSPADSFTAILRSGGNEDGLKAKVAQNPTDPHSYLQLAQLYRRTGRLDEARDLLESGLAPTGNNFELSAELADLEIEPFRQNLEITERRLTEKDDEDLQKIRIRLLKEINSRELELYRQKADRYPEDLSHRFEVGVRLLRAEQVDEAIQQLQAARSSPRIHWKCALYLGYCFQARKNWTLGRRNFEEALEHLPTRGTDSHKEILFQLAAGCAKANELEDAINWGNELANIDFGYRKIGSLLDEWRTRLEQSDS